MEQPELGQDPADIIPAVSKLKWLEPRHLINIENRWARDRTDDFHYMFFNGIGYVSWENVWGVWNQFTARDAEALRRLATLQRKFAELFVSVDWEPYATTLQPGVFASKFPGAHHAVEHRQSQRVRHDRRADWSCRIATDARMWTSGTARVSSHASPMARHSSR